MQSHFADDVPMRLAGDFLVSVATAIEDLLEHRAALGATG
jgi:hypothetical protein